MFEKIMQKKGNKFYSVKEGVIAMVQEELGIILPKELKSFYTEVGYGFLHSDNYNFNRIMSPKSLCEFRFRKGQFSNDSELELYVDLERDKIFFFEISTKIRKLCHFYFSIFVSLRIDCYFYTIKKPPQTCGG